MSTTASALRVKAQKMNAISVRILQEGHLVGVKHNNDVETISSSIELRDFDHNPVGLSISNMIDVVDNLIALLVFFKL
jgi:hypothetical protein